MTIIVDGIKPRECDCVKDTMTIGLSQVANPGPPRKMLVKAQTEKEACPRTHTV